MSELEAGMYELRRLMAALVGSAEPPPGALRALVGGTLLSAGVVGAMLAQRWW